jgi:hypothetical protein
MKGNPMSKHRRENRQARNDARKAREVERDAVLSVVAEALDDAQDAEEQAEKRNADGIAVAMLRSPKWLAAVRADAIDANETRPGDVLVAGVFLQTEAEADAAKKHKRNYHDAPVATDEELGRA